MTTRSDKSFSRRERPAKPALSREWIVATAVALMRREGLERVTMRRLARELDTGPASLYVYVANTAELHAAVLDELLGEVDLGPVQAQAEADWRDRLVRILFSYTAVLFEHPGLARSALVTRPSGRHYLDLLEALLALLAEGGVPGGRAAWGVDVLLQMATATAAEQSTRYAAPDAQEEMDALMAAVRGASDRTHPQLRALSEELFSGPGKARLDWGFRALINGIQQTARPDRR
ncbi:TetR/AcrR family transcriptional regulator [Streptomyces sp. NPDC050287]|uniref:TetR/AcrR family transcriptional regulator n=1 Tax=Streptomyces sp. NPDC050287 TaxID=3365608 RepID=UPI0037B93EB7